MHLRKKEAADVASHDDTQRYVKSTVESYGWIDIYLANAG